MKPNPFEEKLNECLKSLKGSAEDSSDVLAKQIFCIRDVCYIYFNI